MAKFALLLLAFLAYANFTQGLKCYHCVHVEGFDVDAEEVPVDSSCGEGNSPKSTLSVNCEDLIYTPIGVNTYSSVPLNAGSLFSDDNDKNSTVISSKSGLNQAGYIFSCYKVSFDGKLLGAGTKAKASLRSCLAIPNINGITLPDVCYSGTKTTIGMDIQEAALQRLVAVNAEIFDDSTNTGVCNCNSDQCNGAMSSAGVGILAPLIAMYISLSQLI